MKSTERYARHWGDNVLFGNLGQSIIHLPKEIQAKMLGFSEACPVVKRIIKPEVEGGRGPEKMAKRYAEIILWRGYFGYVLRKSGRHDLSKELLQPVERLEGEPLGFHLDEDWVPKEHETHIAGPGTPVSYALPRVLIQFTNEVKTKIDKGANLQHALESFDKVLEENPQDLTELLVVFTEKLTKESQDIPQLVKQILSQGKINEDNSYSQLKHILRTVKEKAPTLWRTYQNLSDKDFESLRIAKLSID
jgi:hypothetical protein